MTTCAVTDCGSLSVARGWCRKHYLRWYKHQNVNKVLRVRRPKGIDDITWFWYSVNKTDNANGCWEWQRGTTGGGYGELWFNGIMCRAHVVSWFIAFNKWPEKFLLHSCDNPPCVNPAHLREGTAKDNALDAKVRNRTCKGSAHHWTKLSESDRAEIAILVSESKLSQKEIGKLYNICQSMVSRIKSKQQNRNRS
jgi:hypothetical protein